MLFRDSNSDMSVTAGGDILPAEEPLGGLAYQGGNHAGQGAAGKRHREGEDIVICRTGLDAAIGRAWLTVPPQLLVEWSSPRKRRT
jgi:hypothetical protein